jgi:uncharacterized membrane-anchored protein
MKQLWFVASLLAVSGLVFGADDGINPSTSDLPRLSSVTGKGDTELTKMDNLIEVTKQNLESQKHLKELVKEYLQVQKIYMQNTSDKQNGYRMVKKAQQVLDKIKENHLTQAFDQDFLSELTFFANIANKWNNPK